MIHLKAALIAALLLIAFMLGGVSYASWLEQGYVNVLAPLIFNQKNQGVAMQQAAFEQATYCRSMELRS